VGVAIKCLNERYAGWYSIVSEGKGMSRILDNEGRDGCDRRRFLALGLAVGATMLVPRIMYSAEGDAVPPVAKAQIAFGVCGKISNAKMLKDAGCEYIEEGVGGILMPDKGDDQFAKRLPEISASLLPVTCCNSFLPGDLKSVGSEAKHAQILAYADIAFHRARMCGVKNITFGSGGSRKIPDGFSKDEATKQFTDLLHRMGQLAAAQEITVAVEPLNKGECNFLNNIREVAAVVAAADHGSIGITADLYHMVLGGDVPDDLDRAVKFLRHFHLAEKEKRALPGVAGDDFRGWFKVLAKHGWKGRISIEANGGGDLGAYIKAFAYLRKQAGEAGI
jgi:sugar phosphate isomerase/epimerase